MKQYPKVPRWDHPVVPDNFYDQDLVVTEKLDGSNFRFMLYDDRFEYSPSVEQFEPSDRDIVFGTKTKPRGLASDPKEEKAGNVRNAMDLLRDEINRDALYSLHDEYGPLIVFAENMVRHTLDYGYDHNRPPTLLGFDVYAPNKDTRESIASHPYEETFEGFLQFEDALDVFDKIGLGHVPVVRKGNVDPTDLTVPVSEIGAVQAEGVVFRSDSNQRRTKLVRDEFRELHKEYFGANFSGQLEEAVSELNHRNQVRTATLIEETGKAGAAYIVDRYITSSRIRKHIQKLLDEEETFGMHLMADLPDRVEHDIWVEEMHEIRDEDIVFNPTEISHFVAERCRNEMQKIEQNLRLSSADDPTELW